MHAGQTPVSVAKPRGRAEPGKGGGTSSPAPGAPDSVAPNNGNPNNVIAWSSAQTSVVLHGFWGLGAPGRGAGWFWPSVSCEAEVGILARASVVHPMVRLGLEGPFPRWRHPEATGWRPQVFAVCASPRGCSSTLTMWRPASSTDRVTPVRKQGGGSDVTLSPPTDATGQTHITQPSAHSVGGTAPHLLREAVSKTSGTDLKAARLHGTPVTLPFSPNYVRPRRQPGSLRTLSLLSLRPSRPVATHPPRATAPEGFAAATSPSVSAEWGM